MQPLISNSQLVWNILQPHLPSGVMDGIYKLGASAAEGLFWTISAGHSPDLIVTPIKIVGGVVFPPLLLNAVHAMVTHTLNVPKAMLNLRWFRPRTNTVATLATSKQCSAQRELASLHSNFNNGLGKKIVSICSSTHWEQFTVEQIRAWSGGNLSTFNLAFQAKAGRTLDAGRVANLQLAIKEAAKQPAFTAYLNLRGELEQEIKKLGVDTRTLNQSSHADADAAMTRMQRMLTRTTIVGIVSALTMASLSVLSALKSRAINAYVTKELFAQHVFGSTAEKAAEFCTATAGDSFLVNGGIVTGMLGTAYRTFAASIPLYCGIKFAWSFFGNKPEKETWWQRLAIAPIYMAGAAYWDLAPEIIPTFLGTAAQSMGLFSTMTPKDAGSCVLVSPLLFITGIRVLKGMWYGWHTPRERGSEETHLQGLLKSIFNSAMVAMQAWMWISFKNQMTQGWQFAGKWAKSGLNCSLMNELPIPVIKPESHSRC